MCSKISKSKRFLSSADDGRILNDNADSYCFAGAYMTDRTGKLAGMIRELRANHPNMTKLAFRTRVNTLLDRAGEELMNEREFRAALREAGEE